MVIEKYYNYFINSEEEEGIFNRIKNTGVPPELVVRELTILRKNYTSSNLVSYVEGGRIYTEDYLPQLKELLAPHNNAVISQFALLQHVKWNIGSYVYYSDKRKTILQANFSNYVKKLMSNRDIPFISINHDLINEFTGDRVDCYELMMELYTLRQLMITKLTIEHKLILLGITCQELMTNYAKLVYIHQQQEASDEAI